MSTNFERVPITNSRRKFIIDKKRVKKVLKWKWCITHKNTRKIGYLMRTATPHVMLHQFLFGKAPKGFEWDHKNGNRLDCRESNLRLATRSQNQWNRRKQKNNTSGFKGVWRNGRGWSAQIWYHNKPKYLGIFDTRKEARYAYEQAARKYHGKFSPVVREA